MVGGKSQQNILVLKYRPKTFSTSKNQFSNLKMRGWENSGYHPKMSATMNLDRFWFLHKFVDNMQTVGTSGYCTIGCSILENRSIFIAS